MKKSRFAALLMALLMIALVASCAATSTGEAPAQTAGTQAQAQSVAQGAASITKQKEADINTEWDDSATKILLDGTGITVDGPGAAVSGGTVTITAAGTYVVIGALADGQIKINATKDDTVHLVLHGATLANSTGAAIYAAQCDKLVVTLVEGTQSSLTDGGASYQYADQTEQEPNAALFCKDDLTINGTGSLSVNAGFHNGIGTKDDLLIVSGTINVSAPNHALRGNDSVTLISGSLTLQAGNDGIQTNNTEDADKGYVLIEGGTLSIAAGHDGIQADTLLTVSGGALSITAGGGSGDTSDSYKGLKSAGDLAVSGGVVTVQSQDDCLHANGHIAISGGSLSLSSGDDGVHADADLSISGGEINVTTSYEGLEAANISISAGTIRINATDDGINAAGGMDSSGMGGRFGRDMFGGSDQYSVTVTGGNIYNVSGGDGIDSNGSYTMSGGTVVSLIQSSPDNGALDCDGNISVTGGTLIYGGTGVGGNPNPQSFAYMSGSVSAGTEVALTKDGKTIAGVTVEIDCQQLMISTPEIVSGETYVFSGNSSQLASVAAGTGGGQSWFGPGGGRGGNPGGGKRGW